MKKMKGREILARESQSKKKNFVFKTLHMTKEDDPKMNSLYQILKIQLASLLFNCFICHLISIIISFQNRTIITNCLSLYYQTMLMDAHLFKG